MKMSFELNDIESARYKRWTQNHEKVCPPNRGTTYSVTFTPNGIGVGVSIKCSKCGKSKDITDYDCW